MKKLYHRSHRPQGAEVRSIRIDNTCRNGTDGEGIERSVPFARLKRYDTFSGRFIRYTEAVILGNWEIRGDALLDAVKAAKCFVVAAIVRVSQGSATVAMITAGGLAAPLVELSQLSAWHTALVAAQQRLSA